MQDRQRSPSSRQCDRLAWWKAPRLRRLLPRRRCTHPCASRCRPRASCSLVRQELPGRGGEGSGRWDTVCGQPPSTLQHRPHRSSASRQGQWARSFCQGRPGRLGAETAGTPSSSAMSSERLSMSAGSVQTSWWPRGLLQSAPSHRGLPHPGLGRCALRSKVRATKAE